MERTPKLILGLIVAAVLVTGLGLYVYLQSREYLQGPEIHLTEPSDGATVATPLVSIAGTARNIAFLSLNGRSIYTDEQGRFKESLLLKPGYSIMTLEAKDRFGHSVEKRLELVYKPSSVIPAQAGIQN